MLIGNKRKIRLSQAIYGIIIVIFIFVGFIPITVHMNSVLTQYDSLPPDNEMARDNTYTMVGLAATFTDTPLVYVIWFILGALIMILYLPALNSLGLTNLKGHRKIRIKKNRLPEYGYTIPINGVQFRIIRKLNSLKGLLLRELELLILLPNDYEGDKRLFDFLACEGINYSSDQIILRKTVAIQNIPLLFFRTKVLLAPSN